MPVAASALYFTSFARSPATQTNGSRTDQGGGAGEAISSVDMSGINWFGGEGRRDLNHDFDFETSSSHIFRIRWTR